MNAEQTQQSPPTMRDVQRRLRERATSARAVADGPGNPDSYGAAALRGKARGYEEAADLIEAALRGGRLRRKWRASPWPEYGVEIDRDLIAAMQRAATDGR